MNQPNQINQTNQTFQINRSVANFYVYVPFNQSFLNTLWATIQWL
jgi:hypothetical protein